MESTKFYSNSRNFRRLQKLFLRNLAFQNNNIANFLFMKSNFKTNFQKTKKLMNQGWYRKVQNGMFTKLSKNDLLGHCIFSICTLFSMISPQFKPSPFQNPKNSIVKLIELEVAKLHWSSLVFLFIIFNIWYGSLFF